VVEDTRRRIRKGSEKAIKNLPSKCIMSEIVRGKERKKNSTSRHIKLSHKTMCDIEPEGWEDVGGHRPHCLPSLIVKVCRKMLVLSPAHTLFQTRYYQLFFYATSVSLEVT